MTVVSRVKLTSTCWLWTGAKTPDGYGLIWIGNKLEYAHRISWKFFYSHIPVGFFVCHKCDVPSCVNPDHLFLGTNADNMQDAKQKGRLSGRIVVPETHCRKGHEYTIDNIVFDQGRRRCKICRKRINADTNKRRVAKARLQKV